MIEKIKPFKVKKNVKHGVCRIIKYGRECQCSATMRGLCHFHYQILRKGDLVNKYGEKSKRLPLKNRNFKIKKNPKENECRIIENSKGCNEIKRACGLCKNHYQLFLQFDLLKKYGIKVQYKNHKLTIRKRISKGECGIKENGKNCIRKVRARGLCRRHYAHFKYKDMLDKHKKKSVKEKGFLG